MSLGSSKSWKEVLFTLTGDNQLDVSGFLEFFKPLYGWLQSINQLNKEEIGWVELNRKLLISFLLCIPFSYILFLFLQNVFDRKKQ